MNEIQSSNYLQLEKLSAKVLKLAEKGLTTRFGGDGGCPQSEPTVDNSGLRIQDFEQNIVNSIEGMKPTMINTAVQDIELVTNSSLLKEEFYEYYINRYSDKGSHTHARFVLRTMERIGEEKYRKDEYFQLLLNSDFLTDVLKELTKTNSFKRRKTVLKQICRFYFDKLNIHKLNPERNKCFNIIKQYGIQTNPSKIEKLPVHPKVEEFENYLKYTLNEKWYTRARLQTRYLLEWLVETNEVEEDNPIEVDLKKIEPESLQKFRNFLLLRIELKQITDSTAQGYIRSIRRWFRFLRSKKYIYSNPCDQLDNIKVYTKEKKELIPVESVRRFFEVLWEDEEALKWLSLFMIIATDGLRANEALKLKPSDVFPERNEIKITRKGGNKRVIPITGLASIFLDLYIKSVPNNPGLPIWRNAYGFPLAYGTLLTKFKRFRERSGIKTVGSIHFFRRLLLSELAYQTMDLDRIKKLADHKTIKNLDPYLFLRKEQLRNKVNNQLPTVGVEYYEWN